MTWDQLRGGVPEVSPPPTGPLTPIAPAPARPEQGLHRLLCVHGRAQTDAPLGYPQTPSCLQNSSDRQCDQGRPVRTRLPLTCPFYGHRQLAQPTGGPQGRLHTWGIHSPAPPGARLLPAPSTHCQLVLDMYPHWEVEKPRPTRWGVGGGSQGRFCEGSTLACPPPRASPAPPPGTKSGLCPAPELSPPVTVKDHAASR